MSDSTPGRKPRVTDSELLAVFEQTDDPVLSTAEVADAVPIKRRGTLNRLQRLADEGELASKQVGGRNTVWWHPEPATATHDTEPDVSLGDDLPAHVADEAARAAVAAAVTFVRDNGPVAKSDILAAVRPDHPLGYSSDAGDGDRDRGAWWRRVVRPGLQASGVEYTNGVGWRVTAAEHTEGGS
jgi:hypothetical protein